MLGGNEPDDTTDSLRQRALERSTAELVDKESPSGSNNYKYGSLYNQNYQPWCAMFITWAYVQEGDTSHFIRGSRYAYVPYLVADSRSGKFGFATTDDP